MIGLDTNVLARYIVRDDPAQTALADHCIEHKVGRSAFPAHAGMNRAFRAITCSARAFPAGMPRGSSATSPGRQPSAQRADPDRWWVPGAKRVKLCGRVLPAGRFQAWTGRVADDKKSAPAHPAPA